MSWNPNESDSETSALIPWKGRPADSSPDPLESERRGAIARTLSHFIGLVKGYTAKDIGRLKEAAVQGVEAKAAKDFAEAEERLGNAARAHAEAEKARAEAYAISAKSAAESKLATIEAVERLEAVISRIRQCGGEVAFDVEQLRQQIFAFETDPPIKLLKSGSAIKGGTKPVAGGKPASG